MKGQLFQVCSVLFFLSSCLVLSACFVIFHSSRMNLYSGRRTNAYENSEENLFWRDAEGVEHFPVLTDFKEITKSHLFHNHNLTMTETMFYKLWPHPLHRDSMSDEQNRLLLKLSLETLWNLLQDPEYVFLALFEHFDIFPELFGTCGGLYIVEALKPLDLPGLLEKTSFDSWADRARVALSILDLLEELDTMFEHPVHLCDVKPEHFGVSDNGRIKYNDIDNVYLKPVLDKSIGDGSECVKHSDCSFFDCQGQCDLIKHKCVGGVVNNNLQTVCDKIFLGKSFGIKSLGGTGLLTSRHGEGVLQPLLESCANPSNAVDGTRIRADKTLNTDLRKALKEIVKTRNRLREKN